MTAPAWLPQLERALAADDARALASIPKTDLHCHGLLSAPRAVYEQVIGRPLMAPPRHFDDFADFTRYIVEHLWPALSTPRSVRALTRGAFERLIDDGVVYAEMSFDLLLPQALGLSAAQFAAMLSEEAHRVADRVTVALEIGVNRALPTDAVLPLAREWIATGAYRSIDLYGDERLADATAFAPLYDLAAAHGLKRKAHAGELCDAASVRTAVEALGLEAVHHGVRAAEDPEVLALLAARGTVLHVCPTSNVALGVCASLDAHPVRDLLAAGVAVTVNTDDFTIFGASVCDEILTLSHMGISAESIAAMIERGLAERDPTERP
jgi:adenosine deaminase